MGRPIAAMMEEAHTLLAEFDQIEALVGYFLQFDPLLAPEESLLRDCLRRAEQINTRLRVLLTDVETRIA